MGNVEGLVDDTQVVNDEVVDTETVEETNEEVEVEQVEETEGQEAEEQYDLTHTYTQEQVESAVKTRVSTFNKKIERMKPYETAVKKISDLTGMDVNTLISRLEAMSLSDQAKVLGITPAQLTQQRQMKQAQREAEQQTNQLKRELEEQKLLSDQSFRDYPLFKEEIQELIEDNPKLTLKQAYMLAKGDSGIKAAARDGEQRAVAKMAKSLKQSVVKPGAVHTNSGPKIDQATITAAKTVGMDPAEYAAYANIDSLEAYEAMRARKK